MYDTYFWHILLSQARPECLRQTLQVTLGLVEENRNSTTPTILQDSLLGARQYPI